MDRERRERLQELYFQAVGLPPGEREALLDLACGGDAEFRGEMERLLGASAPTLPGDAAAPRSVAEFPRRCPRCSRVFDDSVVVCPRDGELLVENLEAIVGTLFDQIFEIEALLGKGGMGAVFRARHRLLDDVVALKFLPREMSANAMWRGRFVREGQAARRFRHPSSVTVYDLRTTADGTLYLVLEYVEGHTLRQELKRRGRIGASEALAIVEPIASVLDTAHAAGVVHRDLKPENVMLATSESGATVVKVLDLGIARLLDAREPERGTGRLTSAGSAVGTPRYMPPEQWGIAPRDMTPGVDGRADVYSLGVMLFEAVCGRTPYVASSPEEYQLLHTAAPIPAPSDVNPHVPEGFSDAIVRALAKDRADRFATAGELVRALRDGLGGAAEPTLAEPAVGLSTGEVEGATELLDAATGAGGNATAERPSTNLPANLSSFFGRREEIEQVAVELATSRLVTLVGPGGIGKTRLAVQVAGDVLERFPDGVRFADLSRLSDAGLVASTVAALFDVAEEPGASSATLLARALAEGRVLVVLDNCEHVRRAAAALASELLDRCPSALVLATSREPLGLPSERVWEVFPLAAPPDEIPGVSSLEAVRASDAVRLYEDRARAVRRTFRVTEENATAVAALCRRLEGIPLAIELAAARTGVMTPAQTLARLERRLDLLASRQADVPDRHRTLRASIEWSVHLLDEPLQRAFARLAVFRGGWTLDAAESVLATAAEAVGDDGAADPVEALEQLRESSLVVAEERGDEMRFRMLETIREFAAETADPAETAALRAAHAAFFRAFTELAEPELAGPDQVAWLDRVDADLENVRAAFEWALAAPDGDDALRIAAAAGRFWMLRGLVGEGATALAAALARDDGAATEVRGLALNWAGNLATLSSDLDRARACHDEAIRIRREIGDKPGLAISLSNRGGIATDSGEFALAERLYEECFDLATELGDTLRIGISLVNRGRAAAERADYATGIQMLERGVALLEEQGHTHGVCVALLCIGDAAMCSGDLELAEERLARSFSLAAEIGDRVGGASALNGLGSVSRYRGDFALAEGRCARALAAARELGSDDLVATSLEILAETALARGRTEEAARLYRECLALRSEHGLRLGFPVCLQGLAAVALDEGRTERAARLLGAADAFRAEIGLPVAPVDRRALDALRERVGPSPEPLPSLDDAIAEALA